MRFLAAAAIVLIAFQPARADDQVRRALDRLAEEAAAFRALAPKVIAEETLRQKALKPEKRRFSPHLGDAPAQSPGWQEREIVSEYAFATLASDADALRELRRPVSVDGRSVIESDRAVARLAASLRSSDDRAKRKLLEEFEKLGLIGTASDFGQLILLFGRRDLDKFDIQTLGERMIGADRALVLRYRQTTGQGLTIWDGRKSFHREIGGELWFREPDLLPVKITLATSQGGPADGIREEAEVIYEMTAMGGVMPAAVVHREVRGGRQTAENRYTYSGFRKFGATTDVHYPGAEANPK